MKKVRGHNFVKQKVILSLSFSPFAQPVEKKVRNSTVETERRAAKGEKLQPMHHHGAKGYERDREEIKCWINSAGKKCRIGKSS